MNLANGDRAYSRSDAAPPAERVPESAGSNGAGSGGASGSGAGSGGTRNRRQERAALRRIAAGEERRRALRLAGALANGSLCSRFVPRRQIVTGEAGATPGALAGGTLRLCLPSRRRGLIDLDPHLRALERADLIRALQRHALAEAAREAASWPAHVCVAVDLLPLAATDGAALEAAEEALAATGLAAGRLVLQIDEGELVTGGLALRSALAAIGAAGIGLAVRGFGETFGALGLPRDLPISALILDRTMLRAELGATAGTSPFDAASPGAARSGPAPSGPAPSGPAPSGPAREGRRTDADAQRTAIAADLIIARAAAALGRGAGLAVIADGIETAGEFARAAAHGIDFAQGPWIGPPMAPDAFAAAIEV